MTQILRCEVQQLPGGSPLRASGSGIKAAGPPVAEQHGERLNIVRSASVSQCPGAAGVIADHPTDSAAGVRRGVRAKAQTMRGSCSLQISMDNPGLDPSGAGLRVDIQNPVQITGIHHDALTHRVTGDRGPGSAHGDRYLQLLGNLVDGMEFLQLLRTCHHLWNNPVEAGVS